VTDLYPTPTRLQLADAIERGEVYGWDFVKAPLIVWRKDELSERTVTAWVGELIREDLAAWAHDGRGERTPIRLTDAGRAWRDAARTPAPPADPADWMSARMPEPGE
jgi:hypothetical protein